MNTYSARWKRKLVWRKEKFLIGHRYDKDQNKMIFYYQNGSIKEVAKWTECAIKLGVDWVLWTKEQMEREANTAVKLNVDTNSKGA